MNERDYDVEAFEIIFNENKIVKQLKKKSLLSKKGK